MTIASCENDGIQPTRPGPSSIFFATTHQELRELQATTAGAGYHSDNHVDHQATIRVYLQENVGTISNLATTTSSQRMSVATLISTNISLAAALMLSNSKLVAALQDVARLTSTISELRRKLVN